MQALRTVPDSLERTTYATCRAGCNAAATRFRRVARLRLGGDDFDFGYSAGVDELFFNEGMFTITVRGGQREGARATVTVKPDIGYPSLRSFVTTVRRPDSTRGPDGMMRLPRMRSPSASADSASGVVTLSGQIAIGDSATVEVAYRDPGLAYLYALRRTLAEQALTVEAGSTRGRVAIPPRSWTRSS
jgi:hypothetical protein